MATKRVLKSLSIEEKYKLLKEVEGGLKKKKAAEKFSIPASTVSTIFKNKESIITSFESGVRLGSKRIKTPVLQNIDKATLDWFKAARHQNMPISGGILKEKAKEFAKRFGDDHFMASTGWLDKWKQRYAVGYKRACGESNDVSEVNCEKWKKDVLPNLLKKYCGRDVFNANESGLFFKCLPDETLTFKNQKCYGGKNSKQQVTLMLAANMDGSEKFKILLIGKSAKPRCFRGIKWLPVHYKANSKAWMTVQIFEEWVLNLDKRFQSTGRKILLFIDNCPAHPKDVQSKLKTIELAYFPPNMTSKLQPLDQGVIQNLKVSYRTKIVKEALKRIEANEKQDITLMDCINHVTKAWDIDVKNQTIANCFKKAGFGQYSEWEEEEDIPLSFFKYY
ncbi:tigger transposable element-derived protein 4-like [Bactrocera neohumeralis]|uniref:tigger transposable element-derived protein 4-like n=1 Tax=Bactrocera neohumeralis TaxID=98809 RepID=UPI00216518CE|nr:tigger transposable element-derived protein 4-like [Bactrocera neohumeralis]